MRISVSVTPGQKQLLAAYAVIVIVALLWGISHKLGRISHDVSLLTDELVDGVDPWPPGFDPDDVQDEKLDAIMEELEEEIEGE